MVFFNHDIVNKRMSEEAKKLNIVMIWSIKNLTQNENLIFNNEEVNTRIILLTNQILFQNL